jgi:Mn-dependent DtxR family transcriptional regulator
MALAGYALLTVRAKYCRTEATRKRMKITEKQYQYLLYLNGHRGAGRTLMSISKYFGVSKPTAFSVLASLQEKGLVKKTRFAVTLTDGGNAALEPMLKNTRDIALWLEEYAELAHDDAKNEAIRMVGHLSAGTVEAILRKRAIFMTERFVRRSPDNAAISSLKDGLYNIPFAVFKKDSETLSMGDLGFRKPARLAIQSGRSSLELKARTIRYAPAPGVTRRGTLERLWYFQDGEWGETKRLRGSWFIPGGAIEIVNTENGVMGRARIRARAHDACGMPESESDLFLYLDQCRKEPEAPESGAFGSEAFEPEAFEPEPLELGHSPQRAPNTDLG